MNLFHRSRPQGPWDQHLVSASTRWGRLTEAEILQSEGRADRLSGLVEKRYCVSRKEADKQVAAFLSGHRFKKR